MCCHCFCQSDGKLHATVVCSIIPATGSALDTLKAKRHKILQEIIGCAAVVHCAEERSSCKAINLHHSRIECEWGFQQGGSALPSWQLEYLEPAEVEARKKHAGQGQTELPDWRLRGHVKLTDGNILSPCQRARVSTRRPHTDTSLILYVGQNWKAMERKV